MNNKKKRPHDIDDEDDEDVIYIGTSKNIENFSTKLKLEPKTEKKTIDTQTDDDYINCYICSKTHYLILPCCKKTICKNCIKKCLRDSQKCPYCRASIEYSAETDEITRMTDQRIREITIEEQNYDALIDIFDNAIDFLNEFINYFNLRDIFILIDQHTTAQNMWMLERFLTLINIPLLVNEATLAIVLQLEQLRRPLDLIEEITQYNRVYNELNTFQKNYTLRAANERNKLFNTLLALFMYHIDCRLLHRKAAFFSIKNSFYRPRPSHVSDSVPRDRFRLYLFLEECLKLKHDTLLYLLAAINRHDYRNYDERKMRNFRIIYNLFLALPNPAHGKIRNFEYTYKQGNAEHTIFLKRVLFESETTLLVEDNNELRLMDEQWQS